MSGAVVRIVPASPSHLAAYLRDPAELSALLDSPVPGGWPEFPEAIPYTLKALEDRPGEAAWWMYFFLDAEAGVLVGSGGFAGPPSDRQVEIGYEIAPEFRRRGYATAAAKALVELAGASGEVDRVIAHTLASDPRSAGVLRAVGFEEAGRATDPENGEVVEWRLPLPGRG